MLKASKAACSHSSCVSGIYLFFFKPSKPFFLADVQRRSVATALTAGPQYLLLAATQAHGLRPYTPPRAYLSHRRSYMVSVSHDLSGQSRRRGTTLLPIDGRNIISMAGRTVPIRVRGRIVAIRARDAARAIVIEIARTPRRVQARTTGGIESRRTPLYHSIRNIAYRIM